MIAKFSKSAKKKLLSLVSRARTGRRASSETRVGELLVMKERNTTYDPLPAFIKKHGSDLYG